jgi:superfamily II DNA or RNA helicase
MAFKLPSEKGPGERALGVWHLAFEHLRDYQKQAINDLVKRWDAGATRVPMVLATGLGKTEIFTPLEALWVAGNEYTERPLHEVYGLGKRVLVIAHTDELIEQAAKKARLRNPSLTVGIVKADRNEAHAQIVISSRQTLASTKRRSAIKNVGLLIIDECHHALRGNTYGKILEHFGALPPSSWGADVPDEGWVPSVKVAGFTATLARGDKGKLSTVWEEVTFRRDILFGIRRGYLLDVRAERIIIPDLDLGNVTTRGGDYTDSSLAEELERRHAPENVAQQYKARAGGRKGIAFWPLVETAYAGAAAFEAEGITSAVVHGALPKAERKQILADFHTGAVQVVHNCMVLTEGFDEPTADVCVVARPTKSAPLYQQMVGRVLRPDLTLPAEQREKALILDVTGAGAINDLRSLIDLSPERTPQLEEDDERSLLELDEAWEEEQSSGGFELPEEKYRGETQIVAFDPLHRERLWAQTPDGTFYMSAGGEQYVFLFEHAPNEWDVIWTNKRGVQKAGMTQYVALPLEDALMFAEDEALERGGSGTKTLTSRKSAWRKAEPTEAQMRMAQGLGVWRDGMSKGEVSEAIDSVMAARRIDPLVKTVRARIS